MRIAFAGTPNIAATILQGLLTAHHDVVAVYTQPDRPSGRGRKLTPSPVKEIALTANIPVHQPISLKNIEEQTQLRALNLDLLIVVAYGLILPTAILSIPRLGCVNVHVSLLPRWRGAAPIARAILAGDTETGVSLMQMDAGLDTGPIIQQAICNIDPQDTTASLTEKLALLGKDVLLQALTHTDTWQAQAQVETGVCYAHKLHKEEAVLDFNLSAQQLHQQIRAFNPWPVAQTTCLGETIRIFRADIMQTSTNEKPGTLIQVSKQGLDVAASHGILRLQQIQRPGGRVLSAAEYINAKQASLVPGIQLGA